MSLACDSLGHPFQRSMPESESRASMYGWSYKHILLCDPLWELKLRKLKWKLEHIINLWCLCKAILTSWYDMNYYSRCKESSVIDIKNLPRITFLGDGKGSMTGSRQKTCEDWETQTYYANCFFTWPLSCTKN